MVFAQESSLRSTAVRTGVLCCIRHTSLQHGADSSCLGEAGGFLLERGEGTDFYLQKGAAARKQHVQLKQKPTQPSGPQRLLIFFRQTSKRGTAGGGIQGASAAPKAPPEGPRAAAEHA